MSTETFVEVMVINALIPMRVVEGLAPLVAPDGTVAVMSSRPGTVSMNERGGPGAQLTVAESVHGIADVLAKHAGDGELQFLDHRDQVVQW